MFHVNKLLGNQSTLQNAEGLLNKENKDAFSTTPKEFTESSLIDSQIDLEKKTLNSIVTEGLFETFFSVSKIAYKKKF